MKPLRSNKIILGSLFGIFGLFIIILICGLISQHRTSKPEPNYSKFVGSQGRLFDSGKNYIVFTDEVALFEVMKAAKIKDNYGIAHLVDAGRILSIPNNIKILILEYGMGIYKVRILEGEYTGSAVWIEVEKVSFTN